MSLCESVHGAGQQVLQLHWSGYEVLQDTAVGMQGRRLRQCMGHAAHWRDEGRGVLRNALMQAPGAGLVTRHTLLQAFRVDACVGAWGQEAVRRTGVMQDRVCSGMA